MNQNQEHTSPPSPTIPVARRGSARSRWKQRIRRVLRFSVTVLVCLVFIGWWRVLRIVEGDNWPPPADAVTADEAQGMTEEFLRRSNPQCDDVAIAYAPTTASDVDLFSGGAQFLPAILNDITNAKSSIHVMMFGFLSGEWGTRIADTLIVKARAGVEVRISVDGYGSKVSSTSKAMFDAMAEAGVQIVVNDIFPLQENGLQPDPSFSLLQNELGRADHRKMLVIDGERGWIGGGGFEDHFYTDGFHDVFVQVRGDIVLQMQAVFLTSFSAYGGPLARTEGSLNFYFPDPVPPGAIPVTLLQNIPGGFVPGTEASREIIEESTERLEIMNPYLTDAGIIDRIVDAADRGVAVHIVVPGSSNNAPADDALMYQHGRLTDAGVQLWSYPTVMHAKVTVADDRVVVGTINYDAWALYRNLEIALLIDDATIADEVVSTFVEPSVATSTHSGPEDGWSEDVKRWFWNKFTYFL
ncbi:MAG: phosphatidylserine/phosphatidylglycerophosphate/cardiolipin synthase family protein [Thermomicrobiales bacterium]